MNPNAARAAVALVAAALLVSAAAAQDGKFDFEFDIEGLTAGTFQEASLLDASSFDASNEEQTSPPRTIVMLATHEVGTFLTLAVVAEVEPRLEGIRLVIDGRSTTLECNAVAPDEQSKRPAEWCVRYLGDDVTAELIDAEEVLFHFERRDSASFGPFVLPEGTLEQLRDFEEDRQGSG